MTTFYSSFDVSEVLGTEANKNKELNIPYSTICNYLGEKILNQHQVASRLEQRSDQSRRSGLMDIYGTLTEVSPGEDRYHQTVLELMLLRKHPKLQLRLQLNLGGQGLTTSAIINSLIILIRSVVIELLKIFYHLLD